LGALRPLPERATDSVVLPTAATASPPTLPALDFAVLWSLALVHNPTLREAAAELEAARGRHLQAAKYPNPRLAYSQENLGTSMGPAGAVKVEITQEILTAGKRPLDLAIATDGSDEALLGLLGRKFDVLTRLRRAYYEYLGGLDSVRVHEETVASLE